MDTGRNRYYPPDRNMPPHNICQPYPVSYLSHHPSGNKYVPNYLSMSNGNPIHNPTMPPDCGDSVWWQNNNSVSRSSYPDQPQRNISPRFTYQENMTRVVVPPNIHRSALHDYSSQSMPIPSEDIYNRSRLRSQQINPVIVQHNSVIYSERPDIMDISSKEMAYANHHPKYYQQTPHNMSVGHDHNLQQRKKTEIMKTSRYTAPLYPPEYMHHSKMYNAPTVMQDTAHNSKYSEKLSVHVSPYPENMSLSGAYAKHGPSYSHEPSAIFEPPASRLPPCSIKSKSSRLSPKSENHYQDRTSYLMPQTSRSMQYNIGSSTDLYRVPTQLHVPTNNNNYAASKYIEPTNNMYNIESEYPKHSVITKHSAVQSVIVSKSSTAPDIPPTQNVDHYNPIHSSHFPKHPNQMYMQPVVPQPYQGQYSIHGQTRQTQVSYNQSRILPQRQSVVSANLEHYKNQFHPYHQYYGATLNASAYNGGRYSPNAISPSDSNASDSNSSGVGSNKHSSYLDDGGYGSRCSTASSIGSGLGPENDLQIKYQHGLIRHPHKHTGYYIKPAPDKGISDFENLINTSVLKRTRNLPQENEPQKGGIDVRKFLQTWGDDEDEDAPTQTNAINNLPDVVISNNINNCDSALTPSHNNYNQFAMPAPNYASENVNMVNNCAQVIKPNTGHCVQVITPNINSCAHSAIINSDKNAGQQYLSKNAQSSEPLLPAAHINIVPAAPTTSAIPEQLYVLEYVNISSEDVEKYKHITQITELPENVHRIEDIENPPMVNNTESKSKLLEYQSETTKESNFDDLPSKKIQPWSQFYRVEPKIGKLQNDFRLSIELDSIPNNNSNTTINERGERPPTPFDVESILQQSIITKDNRENFEMQPGTTSTQIKIMSNVSETTSETKLTILDTEDGYANAMGPCEAESKSFTQMWNKQEAASKLVSAEIIKTDTKNESKTHTITNTKNPNKQSLLKKIRKERNKYKDKHKLKESFINNCKNMKPNLRDVFNNGQSTAVDDSVKAAELVHNNKTDLQINADTSPKIELLNTSNNGEVDIAKYENKDINSNLENCNNDNNSKEYKSEKIESLNTTDYELELDNSTLEENYKTLLNEIENKADTEEVVTLHVAGSESITLHAAPKEKKPIITKTDTKGETQIMKMVDENEESGSSENNDCVEDTGISEDKSNDEYDNETVNNCSEKLTTITEEKGDNRIEKDETHVDEIFSVTLNKEISDNSCSLDEDSQFYESECFTNSIDPLLSPIPRTPGYDIFVETSSTTSEKMDVNYITDQFANVVVNQEESSKDIAGECDTASIAYSEPMELETFSEESNHSIPDNATYTDLPESSNLPDDSNVSQETDSFSEVVAVPEVSPTESLIPSRPNTPGKNLNLDDICLINTKMNITEDAIEELEEIAEISEDHLLTEEYEIDVVENNIEIQKDDLCNADSITIIGEESTTEHPEPCLPILGTDSSQMSPVGILTEYDTEIAIERPSSVLESSEEFTLLFINSNDILLTGDTLQYDDEYIVHESNDDDDDVIEELGDSFEVTEDSEDVVEEIVGFDNIADIETDELNNWPYVEEVVIANSPTEVTRNDRYIAENIASPLVSESENSQSCHTLMNEVDIDLAEITTKDNSIASDVDSNMNSIAENLESNAEKVIEKQDEACTSTSKLSNTSCCETLKHVILSRNISQDFCVLNKKSESSRKHKVMNDKDSDNSKTCRRYSESAISEKSRSEKRHRHLSERNSSWKHKTDKYNSAKQEPIPKVIIRKSEHQHGIVVDNFNRLIDKKEIGNDTSNSKKYSGLKIRIPLNICGSALNVNGFKESLNKCKGKESQSNSKSNKILNKRQPFKVKYKKNFEDVLQDLQYNDLKRKKKNINKPSFGVPKLVIKRYDSNQYTSTTKTSSNQKRCCPSVAIQRNAKIEKLVEIRKGTVKVLPNDKLLLTEPKQSLKCTIRIDTNKISLPPALYKIQKSY